MTTSSPGHRISRREWLAVIGLLLIAFALRLPRQLSVALITP